MTHRNSPIFQCRCCGAVIRQAAFHLPPFCCGREMMMANESVLLDDFTNEFDIEPDLLKPRLAPYWTTQESEHRLV